VGVVGAFAVEPLLSYDENATRGARARGKRSVTVVEPNVVSCQCLNESALSLLFHTQKILLKTLIKYKSSKSPKMRRKNIQTICLSADEELLFFFFPCFFFHPIEKRNK